MEINIGVWLLGLLPILQLIFFKMDVGTLKIPENKNKMDNEQFAIFLEEIKKIQELLKQILEKTGSYT